jgi:hypothetical protein
VSFFDTVKSVFGKPPVLRSDAWQNTQTGYGTFRDKLTYGNFVSSVLIGDAELADLFYSDDVAAKLVEKRPRKRSEKATRSSAPTCKTSSSRPRRSG